MIVRWLRHLLRLLRLLRPLPQDPRASMSPAEQAAFDEGWEAGEDRNPYPPGSALHVAWRTGFDTERARSNSTW